ncbi:MAG: flagellar assembly protein FliW [Ferrimicrobium sp.]
MEQVREVQSSTVVSAPIELVFPIGIPGFDRDRSFFLGGLGAAFGPYLALQSRELGGPTFVVAQPSEVDVLLEVEIDDVYQSLLELQDASDVFVLLIVTLRGKDELPTVNASAPLVINMRTLRGAQVPQSNPQYQLDRMVSVALYDESRISFG